MQAFHKKILFLEMILLYVMIILAVTENTHRTAASDSCMVSLLRSDSSKGDRIDPYKELNKKAALTFDDGPDPDYTPKLLDGLKKRNVKATFFLLGKQIEKYPEIVKRMHEEGHMIGTHSYEHVDLSKLSDKKAMEQVNKTNGLIYDITGEYPRYIRPPFGCWKCNLDCDTNMLEVLWDIDPLDWNTANSDVIAKQVINKIQEYDIILMHDASESSVNAAFKIIDGLKEAGYEFVTLDEIILE